MEHSKHDLPFSIRWQKQGQQVWLILYGKNIWAAPTFVAVIRVGQTCDWLLIVIAGQSRYIVYWLLFEDMLYIMHVDTWYYTNWVYDTLEPDIDYFCSYVTCNKLTAINILMDSISFSTIGLFIYLPTCLVSYWNYHSSVDSEGKGHQL